MVPAFGILQLTFALGPLKEIPYLDHPELKFNEHESTEMPFRYVKGKDGEPIMPEVRLLRLLVSSTLCSQKDAGHGRSYQEGLRQGD